jgi:hypothetical protein
MKKKPDTPAVDATLATLDNARQMICRGTAGLERLRELLGRLDLEGEVGDHARGLLAAGLDRLYAGAAELQTVRPVVLEVVESGETHQGALRRRLRAVRGAGRDEPPYPEGDFGDKKPGKRPRDGG